MALILSGDTKTAPTPKRVARDIIQMLITNGLTAVDELPQMAKATPRERALLVDSLNDEVTKLLHKWGYDWSGVR